MFGSLDASVNVMVACRKLVPQSRRCKIYVRRKVSSQYIGHKTAFAAGESLYVRVPSLKLP
jgi:hypothetical protein